MCNDMGWTRTILKEYHNEAPTEGIDTSDLMVKNSKSRYMGDKY